jgi:hypothetical protein
MERSGEAANTAIPDVAATEAQSILKARAEGRELARIAATIGFPVVVLKGGVNAISGKRPALPLVDIDLLVHHENVKPLVDALANAGFGTPSRELDHHQGLSPSAERLAVEVHWTTHDDGKPLDPGVWNHLRPIDGSPPLMKPGAADNLMHLLEHAILIHRERSVSVRDIVLIGAAASECTDKELTTIRAGIDSSMKSLLDFAGAIARRQLTADPFIEECATYYSAMVLAPQIPKALSSNGALAFALELELARTSRRDTIRKSLRWRGTGQKQLAAIADRIPLIGDLLFAPAHLAYFTAAAAYMLPSIRATRDRALSELDR